MGLNRLAVSVVVNEQADNVCRMKKLSVRVKHLFGARKSLQLADSRDFIYQQDGAHPIFIIMFMITSILHFHIAGLDMVLKMILLFFHGLQAHLAKPPVRFFLMGLY